MRIRSSKLREAVSARAQSPEGVPAVMSELARAVSREGLEFKDEPKQNRALKAVQNWAEGRDHPRCKKADIEALARALGVAVTQIARFESRVVFHRGSPSKAKLVVDLIRGKKYVEAENLLTFSTKRAATNVKKCLMAAMAEAEQAGADVAELVVAESRVDGATHIKRFQPKDRGRAHQILKRQSHITVTLVDGQFEPKKKRSRGGAR